MTHRTAILSLLAATLAVGPVPAQEPRPPAVVHTADGGTQPVTGWSFSWEYTVAPQGQAAVFATPLRKDYGQLWVGKVAHDVAGLTLEVQYREAKRERAVAGEFQTVTIQEAYGLVLVDASGKRTVLKPEPPPRDFLQPGADKKASVQARSLDFQGTTLTGTKRQVCLLTYVALVECAPGQQNQVVKIDFPR